MLAVHAYDQTHVASLFPRCPETCSTEAGRQAFGCRRPIPDGEPTRFEIECYRCADQPPRKGCAVCKGQGRVPVRRCPSKMVGPREVFALQCADMLRAGHLPIAGSFGDWPATLWDAVQLVSQVRARVENGDN